MQQADELLLLVDGEPRDHAAGCSDRAAPDVVRDEKAGG